MPSFNLSVALLLFVIKGSTSCSNALSALSLLPLPLVEEMTVEERAFFCLLILLLLLFTINDDDNKEEEEEEEAIEEIIFVMSSAEK